MGGLEILLAWLGVALVGAVTTLWWSVRAWQRRTELRAWMKGLAALVAVSALLGAFGTLVGLLKAFGAVGGESADPSQKARMLGAGIAVAMNCTAAGLFLWLPSVIALAVVTRRQRAKQ